MKVPPAVIRWCRQNGYGEVTSVRSVGGGCINNGARLETESSNSLFLKQNISAPRDMFAREAEGLRAIRTPDGPRVPTAHLESEHFLLLEDLLPAPRAESYWIEFGLRLAALHAHIGSAYGFEHDNYLGSTPQPNPWTEDGYTFFAEHRLLYQARLAHSAGLLSRADLGRTESLSKRLHDLVPEQFPSLIHGDLWSGNAITDSSGAPAIIDPAVHYGWAEAELGMTQLFGGFPESFYSAYLETRPLESGWRERLPIYNLYHVLNHVNLFGSSYLSQARSILERYA